LRLIPQPNGKGALLSGGKPGNKGGTGRPRMELRDRMVGSLAERVRIAEEIADSPKSAPSDRLRALDFLAKYGLGTTMTETDTEGNDVTVRVVRQARRVG
jgi:hypothetical protein